MAFALKSSVASKSAVASRASTNSRRAVVVRAGKYDEELIATAKHIASPGRGIMAMDESNATAGKRLESINVENTEDNRRAYRELLLSTPGIGSYISGDYRLLCPGSFTGGAHYPQGLQDKAGVNVSIMCSDWLSRRRTIMYLRQGEAQLSI